MKKVFLAVILVVISLVFTSCSTTPTMKQFQEFDEPKLIPDNLVGDFNIISRKTVTGEQFKTIEEIQSSKTTTEFQISRDYMFEGGNNNYIESQVHLIAQNTIRRQISSSNNQALIGTTEIIQFSNVENNIKFKIFNEETNEFIEEVTLTKK